MHLRPWFAIGKSIKWSSVGLQLFFFCGIIEWGPPSMAWLRMSLCWRRRRRSCRRRRATQPKVKANQTALLTNRLRGTIHDNGDDSGMESINHQMRSLVFDERVSIREAIYNKNGRFLQLSIKKGTGFGLGFGGKAMERSARYKMTRSRPISMNHYHLTIQE